MSRRDQTVQVKDHTELRADLRVTNNNDMVILSPTYVVLVLYCREMSVILLFFFFQAEDGIRDRNVTGVQTCALPICRVSSHELRLAMEIVVGRHGACL